MPSVTLNLGLVKHDEGQPGWAAPMNTNMDVLDVAIAQVTTGIKLRGNWANSTIYAIGESVIDPLTGNIWMNAILHTSLATPNTFAQNRTANPTFWSNITNPSVSAAANAASATTSASNAAASAAAAAASAASTPAALSSPTAIGNVTPNTGAFTTLSATGTISGAGFVSWAASPPPIGVTAANSGAFTTLAASGAVSGTGFTNLLNSYAAAPAAIGSTTPAAGTFTTFVATVAATVPVGTTSGHATTLGQVQSAAQAQTHTAFTTAGISTAYTLTPVPAIAGYVSGQRFRVRFHLASGATPTLAISGLAPVALRQYNSAGVKIDAIAALNMLTDVEYDGTHMVVLDSILTMNTARIRGRTTAGVGGVEEITVGTGLVLAAGALTAVGGLAVIATGSLTGAAVAITNIPATFAYLVLQITSASFDTATRELLVQVSQNNGALWDTDAANYQYNHIPNGTGTLNAGAKASLADQNSAQGVFDVANATITILGYQGGPYMSFTFRAGRSGAAARHGFGYYVGSTATINALQILISGTGNFDEGTYTLFGGS